MYIPLMQGSRRVETHYERLNKIDEGTYGVVSRARDMVTGEIFALKQMKLPDIEAEKEVIGFPITSLREIEILTRLRHKNIVHVREVVVSESENVFMVMEYMEHELKDLLENESVDPFSGAEIKNLMLQLMRGVSFLHEKWVIHRDLKTSNLLYNNRGELKICDFGLARFYSDPLAIMTRKVVTMWYRAPELLLGPDIVTYGPEIDVWSIGCIFGELIKRKPLFKGSSETEVAAVIFQLTGCPDITPGLSKWTIPHVCKRCVHPQWRTAGIGFPPYGSVSLSGKGIDLLSRLLELDPAKRLSLPDALDHHYFEEVPLTAEQMPRFAERNNVAHDRSKRKNRSDIIEEHEERLLTQEPAAKKTSLFSSSSVDVEEYLKQLDRRHR